MSALACDQGASNQVRGPQRFRQVRVDRKAIHQGRGSAPVDTDVMQIHAAVSTRGFQLLDQAPFAFAAGH